MENFGNFTVNNDGSLTVRPTWVKVERDKFGYWSVIFLTATHREIIRADGLTEWQAHLYAVESKVPILSGNGFVLGQIREMMDRQNAQIVLDDWASG